MSPPVLYELGFEAAVGWLAKQTRQRFGLDVEFSDDGKAKSLDIDVRVLLFQAVRELLVNVVKHARAGRAKVSVHRGRGRILVSVEDDGVGFDVSSIGVRDYSKGGFGLFNIRERLTHIGGGMEISSKPGRGTRVTLTAPIDDQNKKKKTHSGVKK
jgi:signal transduction histidine kinase